MKLAEYAAFDALGLAELVAMKQVSAKELAETAAAAVEAINPQVSAVVETYADRIEGLDETTLGAGPFRGVPFLMKDVFGHEAGRKIEFGSRLCEGMVAPVDTYLCELFRASGVNILGRSAAPEYSMAGTTESALYGNTSTPWKHGYSAGGSTGGGMAAVIAGIVPIAHGSDIAGSIRIPASFCGGVGLKPSRGRISFGPLLDENGYGLAQNFVQTKSVRDAAAMLDCLAIPQPGDPFVIPKPAETYAELVRRKPQRLRIGWSTKGLMGLETDSEVAGAVESVARLLLEMGHEVSEESPEPIGIESMKSMMDVWFFGFDLRLEMYARNAAAARSVLRRWSRSSGIFTSMQNE
jgi:amidase